MEKMGGFLVGLFPVIVLCCLVCRTSAQSRVNITLNSQELATSELSLVQDSELFVYCTSGQEDYNLYGKLQEQNFNDCSLPNSGYVIVGSCLNSPLRIDIKSFPIKFDSVISYEAGETYYFIVLGNQGDAAPCMSGLKFDLSVVSPPSIDDNSIAATSTVVLIEPSSSLFMSMSSSIAVFSSKSTNAIDITLLNPRTSDMQDSSSVPLRPSTSTTDSIDNRMTRTDSSSESILEPTRPVIEDIFSDESNIGIGVGVVVLFVIIIIIVVIVVGFLGYRRCSRSDESRYYNSKASYFETSIKQNSKEKTGSLRPLTTTISHESPINSPSSSTVNSPIHSTVNSPRELDTRQEHYKYDTIIEMNENGFYQSANHSTAVEEKRSALNNESNALHENMTFNDAGQVNSNSTNDPYYEEPQFSHSAVNTSVTDEKPQPYEEPRYIHSVSRSASVTDEYESLKSTTSEDPLLGQMSPTHNTFTMGTISEERGLGVPFQSTDNSTADDTNKNSPCDISTSLYPEDNKHQDGEDESHIYI